MLQLNFNTLKAIAQLVVSPPRHLVTVVIPIYKPEPTPLELISLTQSVTVLKKYPITVIIPDSLNVSWYQNFFNERALHVQIEKFADWYFANINGYNRLLLSTLFFKRFKQYKYMLICQLDAFIFKDELTYWCNQRYDYIGAIWMDKHIFNPAELDNEIKKEITQSGNIYEICLRKLYRYPLKRVGNGGLSLRNIQTALAILYLCRQYVKQWKYYEDLFWSIAVPNYFPFYKVAEENKAMAFSIETQPHACYNLLNHQLPFGCHAWEKYEPDFWQRIIKYKS
ncbi:DUF5672 family protein [Rhodocytophaga aerolata]|uniref:DUF5672 family protein n=1 Tax=Rhodocytophaga aerolata TaxID=455078 RepID=A0ABT8RFX4_9BACT|nr:DUF5672 family protein [Rhodocytophaga aerolata]MDO1451011.1 DUF5672 family protein [Rhodocytophaga aerolata]